MTKQPEQALRESIPERSEEQAWMPDGPMQRQSNFERNYRYRVRCGFETVAIAHGASRAEAKDRAVLIARAPEIPELERQRDALRANVKEASFQLECASAERDDLRRQRDALAAENVKRRAELTATQELWLGESQRSATEFERRVERYKAERDALADAALALLAGREGCDVVAFIPVVWIPGEPGSGRQEAASTVGAEQLKDALRKAGRLPEGKE